MSNLDSDLEDDDDHLYFRIVENGYLSDSNNTVTTEASGSRRILSLSDSDMDDDVNNDTDRYNSMSGDYDPDIPTAHEYLGRLNPICGYTVLDDGAKLNTYAIFANTIVFPGFTIPLLFVNAYEFTIIHKIINENKRIFTLLCANNTFTEIYDYGVIMEIYETNEKNSEIYLKARGIQRCKKVPGTNIENVAGRIKKISVQILSEPAVISPLQDSQLLPLKWKRKWQFNNFNELPKCEKYRRIHAAQFPFPSWIYNINEVGYYMGTILNALKTFNKDFIPKDPEKLSYWFVQNFPLMHEERLRILKASTTLERLQLECNCIAIERILCCGTCDNIIIDTSQIFMMSKDGMQSNYVNPGGEVYEIITVYQAHGIRFSGRPSAQFSWFPGYAWTIIHCSQCNRHIGWKFTTSSNLNPKEFYGLAKPGLKIHEVERL